MQKSCPVSLKKVDGTIARINAFYITIFVVLFLFSNNNLILIALAIDFAIRITSLKKYSPVYALSKLSKYLLGLKSKTCDYEPKRVAAFFGLLFILIMLIFNLLGLMLALYVISAILLICSSLEFILNYCVGCEVYYIYIKISGGKKL